MAIGMKLSGRFGNNLFQVAAAYSFAMRLKTSFFLDGDKAWKGMQHFNWPGLNPRLNQTRLLWQKAKGKMLVKPGSYLGLKIVRHENEAVPETFYSEIRNNSFYIGNFQSIDYFSPHLNEIRERFILKSSIQHRFTAEKLRVIKKPYTLLHFRRTDYDSWLHPAGLGERGMSLPIEYYKRALMNTPAKDRAKIILTGDDLSGLEGEFDAFGKVQFEKNVLITDFQLLQHASSLVISNSSFAWWAAILGHRVERVVAPKYWLGFKVAREYPNRIIPSHWETVDVYDLFQNHQ